MGPKQAEIAREQEYFDRAREQRESRRAAAADIAQAGAHAAAAAALRRAAQRDLEAQGGDGEAVAFGRIDGESGESLYIGKHLIMGPDHEPMVISWQTPAAEPYYRASHADPMALTLKRTFECTGNHIDDYLDVTFQTDGTEPLLRELARGRTGRLKDIVATIQAAQYELIRAPMEQLLVIEGGPGTGKTAIALHRVSWLLFHHRERLAAGDVLVVGPHPTFTRYIETVLPGLGTDLVRQVAITELAPQVRRGRREGEAVARLKGDARMAALLANALEARIGTAEATERIQAGGRFLTLPGAEVNQAVAACRAAPGSYSDRRSMLRDRLTALVAQRGASGAPAAVGNLLNRLWPQLTATSFLRDLFNSRERLTAAGMAGLTAEELLLLHRRGADRVSEEVWSRDDLPLLDEAAHLIDGPPERLSHIVVDEAQDLSPMQLRSISRRSRAGSMTVIGDLAQSTGPFSRDSWVEVTSHLPAAMPVSVRPLIFGYRVPAQVHDYVRPLLAVAAPGMPAPQVVREGPAEPAVHRVGASERAGCVAGTALAHAAAGRFVGIVCPATLRGEVEEALAVNGAAWSSADRGELGLALNLVSPQEAKGLEFDAVVVVEPTEIVASDPRGHRLLYVAMTRTTAYLDIVCAGDPLPLAAIPTTPSVVDTPAPPPAATRAHQIAAMLRTDPDWDAVLQEVHQLLSSGPR